MTFLIALLTNVSTVHVFNDKVVVVRTNGDVMEVRRDEKIR